MRAASSPAAKRVKAKCVAAVIAAAMNFMMNSHHPHAWTTPVDVRTAGCAMAMFRRQTAAANSTIRKGSAVGPTRWRGASMPAVGLGRVGWPPVGFGARQQARRGPQEDLYRSCAENSLEKCLCMQGIFKAECTVAGAWRVPGATFDKQSVHLVVCCCAFTRACLPCPVCQWAARHPRMTRQTRVRPM